MAYKKNVRNLSIYHSESKRDGNGNLVLSLIGHSPKRKNFNGDAGTRVNATIPFDILPYVLREMKKAWIEERARRLREIQAVDECNFSPTGQ